MSLLPNPVRGDVARLLLVAAAVLAGSSLVQAQQYTYYYPTATATQPTYYYPQPTYTKQVPTYTSQYYQTPPPVQYYQTTETGQYYQTAQPPQAAAAGTQPVPTVYTAPVAEAVAAQPVQTPPAQGYAVSDPYGFVPWLNSVRASYGLGAVGHDANLSNWANMNNSQQMAHGLGHFVMGPARRQNSAMGAAFPGSMWMGSPAHRAALLDPTISWIGIAAAGAYWTFNAY